AGSSKPNAALRSGGREWFFSGRSAAGPAAGSHECCAALEFSCRLAYSNVLRLGQPRSVHCPHVESLCVVSDPTIHLGCETEIFQTLRASSPLLAALSAKTSPPGSRHSRASSLLAPGRGRRRFRRS